MADALYYVRLSGSRCRQPLNNEVNAVITVAELDATFAASIPVVTLD